MNSFDVIIFIAFICIIGFFAYPYVTNKPFTTDTMLDIISPVVAIKGSKQDASPIPNVTINVTPVPTRLTPVPTPTALPTFEPTYVNPYTQGERYEGQWFKWYRENVSGLKDMHAGIIVYRHAWLDGYTWYNYALGQYLKYPAPAGRRYFVVWVHQELLGDTGKSDGRFYGFREDDFRLQYKSDLLLSHDENHQPVAVISEFNTKYDMYNVVIAPPFGYEYIRTGNNPETAGYVAEPSGWLLPGKSNAMDGYIIFEVPGDARTSDLLLIGNFAAFGNAYWRFYDN